MNGFKQIATTVYALTFTLMLSVFSTSVLADPLIETREVIFSGTDLAQKATELNSPASIYEYVRNTHEYSLYHGSRSNTLNTFGGLRGSDVDISSVLIAMYRSQGIPARYAVGNIRVPANDVANWLTVKDIDLAAAIMDDQGIQNVVLSADRQFIDFEHAWVQVQVPYDNYRGALNNGVNCTTTPTRCHWIDLDPSFKLRQFHNQNIDIYSVVNFDYVRYYNAIKNDDAEYRDKGPTEIFEAQILDYLKINFPGKTLEDVVDPGVIVPIKDGLLPASLPYEVIGAINTYDAIVDHDAVVGGKKWAKFLNGNFAIKATTTGGGTISITTGIGGPHALADLSTKRLTVTYSPIAINGVADRVEVRLDGIVIATPFQSSGSLTFPIGSPFTLTARLDGAPATLVGQTDNVINVSYNNMIVGGYYLIGVGGDTSNWSQVHRAAGQLLAANKQFKIINNASVPPVPYVDQNSNGVIDLGEPRLLDDPAAQDALTGGLLYVSMNQYYTRFVENTRRLDALNHVISPMEGFIGIVSSTYEVDYLDGTAFSVMPGGLLIDMKGVQFNGSWRNNAPAAYASDHFELVGHEGSSLEHEIWQEITGFDAVSTVRGIQMAVASGASLQTPENTGVSNNMSSQFAGFQFANAVPAGFTYAPFSVFSTQPATWTHVAVGTSMEVLRRTVNSLSTPLQRAVANYDYSTSNGLYAWVNCVDGLENQLRALSPTQSVSFSFCDGTAFSGTVANALTQMESNYLTYIIPVAIGQQLFDFFDRAKGFNTADHVYRSLPLATNQHNGSRIQDIRDDVMIGDEITFGGVNGRWEYVIPGRKTQGDQFRFSVFLEKIFDPTSGSLSSQSYSISNDVFLAGGGWVDGANTLNQSTSLPGTSVVLPTFNNEVFTDLSLVSQTNNDLIRTPSTADPISTVTGNMYHDETDITIKSRGINYAFTRSYNSAPARAGQDSALGFGWTHSYNMSLRSNDYGDCPNCGTGTGAGLAPENGNNITASITYIDERGGEHTYLVNEATLAVTPPPGEYDNLQLNTPAVGQTTLTFRNGTKYVFSGAATFNTVPNQTARLNYIEDAYANRLTMGYDASNRLSTISDNLGVVGRTGLTLSYTGTSTHIQNISDWSGRNWAFGYDANNNLTSITNPLNDTVNYTYHAGTHLLNDMTLPENRSGQSAKTTFTYYRNNKAFTNANALGEGETVDYDLYRQRTRVSDPRGFIRTHFYDKANGALLKLEEPDGAILRFNNTTDAMRYSKTNGLGFTTQYSYKTSRIIDAAGTDNFGRVSREMDALNQTVDTDYGLYDQPTLTVNKRGTPATRSYYATTNATTGAVAGKLKDVRTTVNGAPNVLLESYTYYATGTAFGQLKQRIETIDPAVPARQRITNYVYETNGINLQSQTTTGATAGGSISQSFTYDALGRVLSQSQTRRTSATNATLLTLTTTLEYDALGRVIKTTNPRGDIAETVYDKNGQVSQQKVHYFTSIPRTNCAAPLGGYVVCTTATHSYDAADRRTSTTDLLGNITTFSYDANGNLIATTDANGHTARLEYDQMNRRTAVIDANGHRSEMSYDLGGRLIATKDANGNQITFEYDALGRQTRIITPLGFETQTQYDANNNVTHITDANGVAGTQPKNNQNASTYQVYDELNRLTLSRDALNGDTQYTYDLLGNITRITDAIGQATSFIYDDLGRLIETRDPIIEAGADKTDKVLQYDEIGNVLLTEDRTGRQRRHTYDNLNRRILTEYLSDATQDSYTYDAFGDLTQLANSDVTYSYSYTPRHELQSKTDSRLGKTLNWTYDAIGNLISKTDYQNEISTYQYDSTNRLVAMRNPAYLQVSYHYDGAGRLLNRILSNGAQTDYKYDNNNRLTGLKNISANKTVVENLNYQRDNIGNITRITNSVNGKVTAYTYNARYQLSNVNSTVNSEDRSYTYDAVGNRKTLLENAITYYYNHSTGNRLSDVRTGLATGPLYRQFTYDDAGRITAKSDGNGVIIYLLSYTDKGQVFASYTPLAGAKSYAYDANDYRIRKDNNLYHLEGENLEATYSSTGVLENKYLRGVIVDEIVNGFTYHSSDQNDWTNYTFHHDHLNSVTAQTGHAGTTEETTNYDAFGSPSLTLPGTGNDLLYTGREYDRETSLYYYRARYYDAEIGRFISEDPLGFGAGVNFYAYVNNNPVNFNDPSGRVCVPCVTGLIAGGGAALGAYYSGADTSEIFAAGAAGFGVGFTFGAISAPVIAATAISTTTSATLAGAGAAGELLIGATGALTADAIVQGTNIVRGRQETFDFGRSAVSGLGGAGGALPSIVRAGSTLPAISNLGPRATQVFLGAAESTLGQTSAIAATEVGIGLGINATSSFFSDIFTTNLPSSPVSQNASGGFVLYPNRPNTNMLNTVYQK